MFNLIATSFIPRSRKGSPGGEGGNWSSNRTEVSSSLRTAKAHKDRNIKWTLKEDTQFTLRKGAQVMKEKRENRRRDSDTSP